MPDSPAVRTTPSINAVTLSISKPRNTGGLPIIRYSIMYNRTVIFVKASSPIVEKVIVSLVAMTTYTFTVKAFNRIEESLPTVVNATTGGTSVHYNV